MVENVLHNKKITKNVTKLRTLWYNAAMKILSSNSSLRGSVTVPGSKSHTIRALLLAALSDGVCHIYNPLPSADCLSTSAALPLLGASVDLHSCGADDSGADSAGMWTVYGAGKNIHLPSDVVNVGDSGSLLYFLSSIAATFEGWTVFTGDESIRKRPVHHVVEALNQLGAECYVSQPGKTVCPLLIKGPVKSGKVTTAGEVSSQYISGMMMAALRVEGGIELELTNPKETPYLTMTQKWLEKAGAHVEISSDFKHIKVDGPVNIKAFDSTVPSDWEGVAFPLIAALLTDSDITIEEIDGSGTQGDEEIVKILQSVGGEIEWDKEKCTLHVCGGSKAKNGTGRLTTENLPGKELHVKISGFPDAICAVAVAAAFTEGTVYIEDAAVCRRKETDRIKVMTELLKSLGADVEEGSDFLVIRGHSPINADGSRNKDFALHGGNVESYDDHRIAMSFACFGLGLPEGEVIINNAECCAVSFPHFYEVMNELGAGFSEM